LMRG